MPTYRYRAIDAAGDRRTGELTADDADRAASRLAGVRSGDLGHVLGQFVRTEGVGAELRRTMWLSLAYPLLLLGSAAALLVFLGVSVVNRFAAIYADFGMDLPRLTVALINASRL